MQADPPQPSSVQTGKWLAVGLALLISWGIFAFSTRKFFKVDELSPPSLENIPVPRPVTYNWTLLDLDDKPVDFSKFQGKPIVLNLWATWCGPCLMEMPSLVSLANSPDLKGREIVFLCVSTDQSAETLRAFLKSKDWNVTILRATGLPPCFETQGIPATFVISPQGQIVTAEIGAAKWDDPSVIYFLQKMANK